MNNLISIYPVGLIFIVLYKTNSKDNETFVKLFYGIVLSVFIS